MTTMIAAARQSGTVDRWSSKVRSKLGVGAPGGEDSRILLDLCNQVREWSADRACLQLLREEHALLIAMARKCAEERKESRKNNE